MAGVPQGQELSQAAAWVPSAVMQWYQSQCDRKGIPSAGLTGKHQTAQAGEIRLSWAVAVAQARLAQEPRPEALGQKALWED